MDKALAVDDVRERLGEAAKRAGARGTASDQLAAALLHEFRRCLGDADGGRASRAKLHFYAAHLDLAEGIEPDVPSWKRMVEQFLPRADGLAWEGERLLGRCDKHTPFELRAALEDERKSAFRAIDEAVWDGGYPGGEANALKHPEKFIARSRARTGGW